MPLPHATLDIHKFRLNIKHENIEQPFLFHVSHVGCLAYADYGQTLSNKGVGLFELMLKVPVNSHCRIRTWSPFCGTYIYPKLGCHDIQNVLQIYHPRNPLWLITYGWHDLKPLFPGRLRSERLISNQMVSQKCISFARRHKQPI